MCVGHYKKAQIYVLGKLDNNSKWVKKEKKTHFLITVLQ